MSKFMPETVEKKSSSTIGLFYYNHRRRKMKLCAGGLSTAGALTFAGELVPKQL